MKRLTVKNLREALNGLPDDMPVAYQRIEDRYFDEHGWTAEDLIWQENMYSYYIYAFSAYETESEGVFIINAHF